MLTEQFDPLVLSIYLVPLIIDDIPSVYHPEVKVNVNLEFLATGLLRFA